jgi:hypothetical protein
LSSESARHVGHEIEASRHVVEVTAEGFQVLDTWTEALRADVWSTREQAQDACEELNGSVGAEASAPARLEVSDGTRL